jgi:hypothetical protein
MVIGHLGCVGPTPCVCAHTHTYTQISNKSPICMPAYMTCVHAELDVGGVGDHVPNLVMHQQHLLPLQGAEEEGYGLLGEEAVREEGAVVGGPEAEHLGVWGWGW